MTKMLRIACVGAGYFSQFHLGSWTRIKGATVVGMTDRDCDAAARTGQPVFCDTEDMIRQTEPDVLDIILPPDAHAETIRCGLELGVKTIICQKPFCRSLEEAEQIALEAKNARALVIVHENFRFMPWYRFLKSELAKGTIGKLHQAYFRLRPGDGQGADAYLNRQPYFQRMERFLVHETAVHWIDTFRFLLGDPLAVYADLRRLNPVISGEDAGLIIFEHPGNVRAVFDGDRNLDHASDNLRRTMGEAIFEGTGGALTLHGDGRVDRRLFGELEAETVFPSDAWVGFGGDCVHALQSHVIEVLNNERRPENLAQDYCTVLRVRDAIYRSSEVGARVAL